MTTEQVFLDLPETETFNVFRIENFKVVPWKDIGAFYTGDAYIVLNAYKVGTSQRVQRDIFFWLGAECTQDESGTAAIKSVELDDRFKGEPTQHREIQGHESDAFMKAFEKYGGVRYMDGGIDSGFRKVDPNAEPTVLYQIKGRRHPVLQQVPPVGTSLNQGDVFIVVAPGNIFLWIGKNANLMEKNKGAMVLEKLKSQNPKHKSHRLEGGETTPEFWQALGGETAIADAKAGGADEEHEAASVRKIFKVEGGKATLVAEGNAATRDKLQGASMYIIQRGNYILVYAGNGVPAEEIKQMINIGVKFIGDNGLPNWTPIATVREGVASQDLEVIFA
ncbi:actin-binding protein [Histomonas meleagridis]|uniref:actin-binding protein n=1 Tax=Histomonas meleagridis TaxID=135588 RepID=UPI00355A6BEF|nr:actin-binding protein [Histomonas meleagridis]KAH0801330.1 actin-binding protein [Histomonas meleagridis]